uniref:E3 ubiquitin-protein ligase FANCL-like isoform X1 n=1 Tax=Styela clava TaxID=7725 RepID=UPI00193A263A|nr:E3 ubiquitin-protein ligase FANCL-like isoform X1 [Styela clava]
MNFSESKKNKFTNILLFPSNCNETHYHGFIEANGVEYYIELMFTKPFQNARVKCEYKLQQRLKDYSDDIKNSLKKSKTPQEFAKLLQNLLCRVTEPLKEVLSVEYTTTLVKHIEDVGWSAIKDVNNDFTRITLSARDVAGREHELVLHPSDFPKQCPEVTSDLPYPFRPQWGGIFSSLKSIYQQFIEVLLIYQRFWDEVEELQQKCWILEPDKPSYRVKDYRIYFGASSSILITIDPVHPENIPECRFMGAEASFMPIRQKFMKNIQDWNGTLSILQNLKNILQIDFPRKSKNQAFDVTLQCGICYEYKLVNNIPDQACNEPRCGQLFHKVCLVEWIQSVPGAKQSFQTLFGECPYCNNSITVKL